MNTGGRRASRQDRFVRGALRAIPVALLLFHALESPLHSAALAGRAIDPGEVQAANIDLSLGAAAGYVRGLYREIDVSDAIVAEYYALPIRVYLPDSDEWILVGAPVDCDAPACKGRARVIEAESALRSESEIVSIERTPGDEALRLRVSVDWESREISIADVSRGRRVPAIIYLGSRAVADYRAPGSAAMVRVALDSLRRSDFASLRYTIRHGSQAAQSFFWRTQDVGRFQRVAHYIERLGYTLDYDMRAPIWG